VRQHSVLGARVVRSKSCFQLVIRLSLQQPSKVATTNAAANVANYGRDLHTCLSLSAKPKHIPRRTSPLTQRPSIAVLTCWRALLRSENAYSAVNNRSRRLEFRAESLITQRLARLGAGLGCRCGTVGSTYDLGMVGTNASSVPKLCSEN